MEMRRPSLSAIKLLITLMFAIYKINSLPLPDDLDSFLEILFEKTECEDFLSESKWSTVGLRDCKPFICDFPRELCRRPAATYQDETGNTCFKIPDDCLTAANGGEPLTAGPFISTESINTSIVSKSISVFITTTISSLSTLTNQLSTQTLVSRNFVGLERAVTEKWENICTMEQPQGRFCGFKIKVAYNSENQRCEQFWFPGCKTAQTNQNLFDTIEECENATRQCKRIGSFVPLFITSRPGASIVRNTPSLPVPLVAPFLATTLPPESVTQQTATFFLTSTAPIARPLPPKRQGLEVTEPVFLPHGGIKLPSSPEPPVQSRRLINPSSASTILGLISSGISQFTGAGWGDLGTKGTVENSNGGSFFSQIPQLIRSLQIG